MAVTLTLTAVACGDDEAPNPNPPREQTETSTSGLSTGFKEVCATCHGEEGRGKGRYPSIPGNKDESAFIAIVRSGRGDMPATDASRISDAELRSDYAWLTTKRR